MRILSKDGQSWIDRLGHPLFLQTIAAQFVMQLRSLDLPAPTGFVDTSFDGRYFYSAVAHQTGLSIKRIQEMVMNRILIHPADYQQFLHGLDEVPEAQPLLSQGDEQGALQVYIEHHLQEHAWADNSMIQATANALGVSINVHMFNPRPHSSSICFGAHVGEPVVISTDPSHATPTNVLVLGNIANVHFVSLAQAALPPDAVETSVDPTRLDADTYYENFPLVAPDAEEEEDPLPLSPTAVSNIGGEAGDLLMGPSI